MVTVFGILNLTEDSFFDESRRLDPAGERTPAAPSLWYSDDLRGHRWRQRQRHHACAVCRCRTPSSRARAVLLNDGGWWSPWHCHSCVGRRPDISAELAGGGILWLCGGLASAFTVARRAGADVVGRARGTADRLSLSHSQRCHLQAYSKRQRCWGPMRSKKRSPINATSIATWPWSPGA